MGETDAICLPSGERVTVRTLPGWPVSVFWRSPVVASQSLIVLSSEPDAICLPSGEKATVRTGSEWPASVCIRDAQLSSIRRDFSQPYRNFV